MNSGESKSKKKIWSGDALLKAMQPTPEELEYRKEKSKEPDFLQKYSRLFKCTKCQVSFKQIIVRHEKIPTHPSLGVLMCQNCCNYYEDGEFSLDSDGEDKYCRWCGEGGTIFSCSGCVCGFCTACIKRHFTLDYFKQVQKDEEWLCFFCNPRPLWDQRFVCSLAKNLSENVDPIHPKAPSKKNKDESDSSSESFFELENSNSVKEKSEIQLRRSKRKKVSNSGKINANKNQVSSNESDSLSCISLLSSRGKNKKLHIYTSSSDDSDVESSPKRVRFSNTPSKNLSEEKNTEEQKSDILSELKKILVLSKHQMEFCVNWSNNALEALEMSDKTSPAEILKECKKIKWFLSTISTYLVQFSNSIDILEKSLPSNYREKSSPNLGKNDHSGYMDILQFLGFVRNQVQMFIEKDIRLHDIFASEVYDDDNVIGIKKKSSNRTSTQYISTKSDGKPRDKKNASKNDGEKKNESKDDGEKKNASKNDGEKKNIADEGDESGSSGDDVLIIDEGCEKKKGMNDEESDNDSSNTPIGGSCKLPSSDPREDIRQILAILENA